MAGQQVGMEPSRSQGRDGWRRCPIPRALLLPVRAPVPSPTAPLFRTTAVLAEFPLVHTSS